MTERKKATDFDQELLDLFDEYVHRLIERREFLHKAAKFAIGGLTAVSILDARSPDYVLAKQGDENDPRIRGDSIRYPSPKGTELSTATSSAPPAAASAGASSSFTRTGASTPISPMSPGGSPSPDSRPLRPTA